MGVTGSMVDDRWQRGKIGSSKLCNMIGGKTHDYPHGKPFPLVLLDIAMVILGAVWVFLSFGNWPRTLGVVAVFLVIAFISAKLHRHYQRTGQAVPIRRPRLVVKWAKGLPGPMVAARLAFFITVAVMVFFGVSRVADSTARGGIIACVLALFGVAVLNVVLERHYVNTGRATEVDVSAPSNRSEER